MMLNKASDHIWTLSNKNYLPYQFTNTEITYWVVGNPEYGASMPQVSRQMQVEYAYPSSRSSVH